MTNLKSLLVKAVFILGCVSMSNGQSEGRENRNPADPWLAVADSLALDILNELNKKSQSKDILLPITTDGNDSILSDKNDASENLDEYQDEDKTVNTGQEEATTNSHDLSSYVRLLLQIFQQYQYIFKPFENEGEGAGKNGEKSGSQKEDILKFNKEDFDVAKMLLKD